MTKRHLQIQEQQHKRQEIEQQLQALQQELQRYIDLDTPMLLADDPFMGGYEQLGGIYDLSGVKSGLGIERK